MKIDDFEKRLDYLYIGDKVGHETFGSMRYVNQALYTSPDWRRFRRDMIIRDNGCDLAMPHCEIDKIILHHINPLTVDDVLERRACVFDPDNVVCVSKDSHDFIHFGKQIDTDYVERTPNDTCPWKR